MLPAAGVYVSVCVSPDCDADAVMNDAATVPVPSAASFFSANRCAAQSELVTHVAVLFPDAPAAAWTPSAKPAVTFVTAGGRHGPLAHESLRRGLRDGHAVGDAVGGLQHLARRRRRDRKAGRVAGRGGAAAVHRRDGAATLVEADERVDALVRDETAGRVGVAARPCERDRARLGAVDEMPVDRLLDRAGGVLRRRADLVPAARRRDRARRADRHLRDHHVAADRGRRLRDAEARRAGRRGRGAARRPTRTRGETARGDQRDRVDQVRNREDANRRVAARGSSSTPAARATSADRRA